MTHTVKRYHDISCGHRVAGHESKCANLHGHNYRITFHCRSYEGDVLDTVGRVIDFSVIKEGLCEWVEKHWDHKFLVWEKDPLAQSLLTLDPGGVLLVTFNPTAENMAKYLVRKIGPYVFASTGIELYRCDVEETRKCTASYSLQQW